MTPWPARETFDVVVVGKRLSLTIRGGVEASLPLTPTPG